MSDEDETYVFDKREGKFAVYSQRKERENEIIAGIFLLFISIFSFSFFIDVFFRIPWPECVGYWGWGWLALWLSIFTFIFALILLTPD